MKKLGFILAAAAMLLLSSCGDKKDAPDASSEVGKWYGYNIPDLDGVVDKNDVAYVLDLQAGGKVDFIISAWGNRWKGNYTYDGTTVVITYNAYMGRPNAFTLSAIMDPCAPENLYSGWTDYGRGTDQWNDSATQFGETISIGFTHEGNSGTIDFANKPCPAERQ